jgi:hypothetical protein
MTLVNYLYTEKAFKVNLLLNQQGNKTLQAGSC